MPSFPAGASLLQFLRLRSKLTFLFLAAFCVAARADVIHLKNGKHIVADSTQQVNGRVEYTIGENTFAIPQSLVERIDTGPVASVPNSAQAVPAEDIPSPQEVPDTANDLAGRVIHDGQIDAEALKKIEAEG